jgi:NADH-quinone oxidoreductase subunit C
LEPLQIAEKLREQFSEDVSDSSEFRGQVSVTVDRKRIVDICRWLHDEPELKMDLLRDLAAVDYLGRKDVRFEVVYHLFSIVHRHLLRLKAPVPEQDCSIDSITSVHIGANWHEREAYDLFGITFKGHPDHRRILMPEDWVGYPLRKDYPTEGPPPEDEWPGFKEVLEKAERLKEYEWEK